MKVKGQILSVIADMESKVIESKTDVNARMIASSLISKKFMVRLYSFHCRESYHISYIATLGMDGSDRQGTAHNGFDKN